MKFSLSIIFAFALASRTKADEEIGLCCLCDSCGPPVSGRATLAVDSQGTTCQQLVIDMADPTNIQQGNQLCRQLQGQWYDHCCNPNHTPSIIAQNPTVSEGASYPSGPYSSCNLCENGQYPSLDQTLVAVLDFPNVNTCKELYWWAKQGNFEDRMCRPIQNYFAEPCGCGSSSSSNQGGTSSGSPYQGGTSSGSNYNTGGGAPDQSTGNTNQGSTSTSPDKKVAPDESKEDKLYSETDRGTIRRTKRRLKGSE
ncbi:hypothetical protein FisN_1Hh003 [Fistulifera solaris]|jgi:hypothetical protein|uniref:Niemann-Pick C1 N-terminal domain-containing protein n=1 Tax=Fistulifera solaris TaxID=1519565 RepID=A0A1Z5KRT8_FISSO|nr:hypothetical protein FisN_1Hh003 [Fistulifera solaris]|eukprot:GAX28999.1 hypothetical protein FisN_1Hh003 [Fistulifera solaris]